MWKLLGLLLATRLCSSAAPEIRSILNAASYAPAGMPNSAIAQGSIFVIFGVELGPAVLQQAIGFPLPTRLGDTSMRVTVGSTSLDVPMLYVWEKQVAGILPSRTPTGIGYMEVTYAGRTSQAGAFRIVRSSPGILAQNQAGSGAALAQNFNSMVDQPRNTLTRPAQPGQMVTLWATGLGPVTHDDASLPVPRDLDVNLEVLVGGRPATVRYKGRSGCCAGADQINFEVPRDISGCYVPVVVRAGDVVSNFTTISVAPAGAACTDLNGITGPEIERLQNGGELRFGAITLSAVKYTEWSGEAPGYYEHATGEFFRFNWDLVRARLAIGQAPPGSCMFFPPSQIIPGIAAPTPLEAGTALNLSGPKGVQQLSRRVAGVYNHEFAAGAAQLQYLQSGTYTVDNGSGGADVGAFRAAFTIPPELKTTVQQSATGTTVSWTGGDPSGLITISGFSQTPIAPAGPRFSCTERVSAGRFAVPSYVLSSFPADAAITINAQATAFSPQTQFRAPGLDAGYIFFVTGEY